MADRKRIVHVIDRLVIGGMENGIVNLINATSEIFEHKIVCLRYFDQQFEARINVADVEVVALGKKAGKDPSYYRQLFRTLRKQKPDIVHTRNLPTIDLAPVIRAAGVRCHVHGEHGRDRLEPDGNNRRYNRVRKLTSPFVDRYVCVSKDIARWLHEKVGISERKIEQIYNGVDTNKFSPRQYAARRVIPIAEDGDLVIGTVGRMEAIKDQITLVNAFVQLARRFGDGSEKLKLAVIGDGTLRQPALDILEEAGLQDQAWLPGACDNVAEIMAELSVFVLPSENEGISNTILEAMASELPVVATAVGGNRELVIPEKTGMLVPPKDPDAMCQALMHYARHAATMAQHGKQARSLAVDRFSLAEMISRYTRMYQLVHR